MHRIKKGMMQMYIVVEYLLLENFLVNYLILYINTYLVKVNKRNLRLISASIISSLYSLIFFFPILRVLSGVIPKLILSMVIIIIAYEFINFKIFLKELMGFYLVTFIYGGATLSLFYSSNGLISNLNKPINALGGVPIRYLILGMVVSTLIGKSIFTYFNEKIIRDNYITECTIEINDEKIKLKALLDTGHSLKDPFTGRSIFVVEYNILKEYLPADIENLMKASCDNNFVEVEFLLSKLEKKSPLTIVPFKSVGKNGILFAFKPNAIIIQNSNKVIERRDMLIGLYAGSLSKDMGYSGLLNYELINGGDMDEQVFI